MTGWNPDPGRRDLQALINLKTVVDVITIPLL
jgi:hypothetical protein